MSVVVTETDDAVGTAEDRPEDHTLKEWPLGEFDCLTYRDPDSSCPYGCTFIPYFIPMSVCGTCIIAGKLESALDEPDGIWCFEMGKRGWLCCALMAFPNIVGPGGGCVVNAIIGAGQRKRMQHRYHLKTHKSEELCGWCFPATWTCCHDSCELLQAAVCFPCNFFQMYTTMKIMNKMEAAAEPLKEENEKTN